MVCGIRLLQILRKPQIAEPNSGISRNTEAVDGLSRKFFGVVTEKGKGRTTANAGLIDKAVEEYYRQIRKGVKGYFAITDACTAVVRNCGLGDYKNFATFRNMVNRVIARRKK